MLDQAQTCLLASILTGYNIVAARTNANIRIWYQHQHPPLEYSARNRANAYDTVPAPKATPMAPMVVTNSHAPIVVVDTCKVLQLHQNLTEFQCVDRVRDTYISGGGGGSPTLTYLQWFSYQPSATQQGVAAHKRLHLSFSLWVYIENFVRFPQHCACND